MLFFKKLLKFSALILFMGTLTGERCSAADADIPPQVVLEIADAAISPAAKEEIRNTAQMLSNAALLPGDILQQIQALINQRWEQEQAAVALPLPAAPPVIVALPAIAAPVENLYQVVDSVAWNFLNDAGKAVERAWLDEQFGAERAPAEIRNDLQQRIANHTMRSLQPPIEITVPGAADRAAWLAANNVPADTTCPTCQESLDEIEAREQIADRQLVRLRCNHFLCKNCCLEDFNSYEHRMIESELDPAMAAMKTQVEEGEVDIMEFPEAVRDALLNNRMLTPDPVQQLFEMRQFKCPICRSISGIIDEE